jgi:hypothetical protein
MRGLFFIAAVVLACLAGVAWTDGLDVPGESQGSSEMVAPAGNPAPGAVVSSAVAPRDQHHRLGADGLELPETGMGVRPAARGTDTASAMTLLAGIAVMAYGLRKRRRR